MSPFLHLNGHYKLQKAKYNVVLFCGFKDAGLERFRFKYYSNSITWKQASGIEWAICNVLLLLNKTVQR